MGSLNVNKLCSSIKGLISAANKVLTERDQVREEVIKVSRDLIRESGYTVTSIHAKDLERARKHLTQSIKLFRNLLELTRGFPEIRYTGLVYNAESEYVEAVIFYSIVVSNRIPDLSELRADPVPLIQGLLDVVGELKRYILELAGEGKFDEANEFFRIAEIIYEEVKPLDYPDPLLPGVRRKLDIARATIESLRALLIDLRSRHELMNTLTRIREEGLDWSPGRDSNPRPPGNCRGAS